MARRRHLLNPVKVKADFQALEQQPEASVFAEKFGLHRKLTVALLNLLAAVVLAVSFPLVNHWPVSGEWYLAYVALVPWTLALAGQCGRVWQLIFAFVGAVLFWATMYYLVWITLTGYFPLILTVGAFWLVAAVVVRSALRKHWPMWIVLPVVWVSLEYGRAHFMTGYTWYNLSLTQYARVGLIQISDLTGHYGVSFFVAMVNGAIVDVCLAPWRGGPGIGRRIVTASCATLATLGILVSYGAWRINQSRHTTTPGPVIGVVQRAIPISLGGSDISVRHRVDRHVNLTRASLKNTRCELVIWPETMLPEWVNPEMLEVDVAALAGDELKSLASIVMGRKAAVKWTEDDLRAELIARLHVGGRFRQADGTVVRVDPARAYAEEFAALAAELDCALLAGGATGHPNPEPIDRWDHWVIRNSALWFDPVRLAGSAAYERRHLATAQYAKRHLVPFSESVPFKHSWPWLHMLLRKFIPPGMPQIDAGKARTRFELKRLDSAGPDGPPPWRLAVVICFEGTFARRCREAVMQDGEKVVDILVNLSNDGWFVFQHDRNSHTASTEHMQHMAQYCFRAVENRVPVIRAVNTGVSASINSNGRVVAMIQSFDGRTDVPGTMLLGGQTTDGREIDERVLVDSRVSPYSLVGDVFAMGLSAAAVGMVLSLVVMARRGRGKVQKNAT